MAVKPKLPGKSSAGAPPGIGGMSHTHADIGEKSGWEAETGSYINKKGTPYGESANFNKMPPGMDISNQDVVDIRNMELKTLTSTSYPGDGWGASRDIPE